MTDQMGHFLFLSLALSHSHTHCLSISHTSMFFLSPSLFYTNALSHYHPRTHCLSLSLKHIDCLFITYPRIQKRTRHMFFLSLTLLTLAHSYSNQHTPKLTHTLTTQTHFITHTESRTHFFFYPRSRQTRRIQFLDFVKDRTDPRLKTPKACWRKIAIRNSIAY